MPSLLRLLDGMIHHDQDHILFVDVGPADHVVPRVVSLGKDSSRSPASPSSSDFAAPRECSSGGEFPGSARSGQFFV
jgi:hypothetical protein